MKPAILFFIFFCFQISSFADPTTTIDPSERLIPVFALPAKAWGPQSGNSETNPLKVDIVRGVHLDGDSEMQYIRMQVWIAHGGCVEEIGKPAIPTPLYQSLRYAVDPETKDVIGFAFELLTTNKPCAGVGMSLDANLYVAIAGSGGPTNHFLIPVESSVDKARFHVVDFDVQSIGDVGKEELTIANLKIQYEVPLNVILANE